MIDVDNEHTRQAWSQLCRYTGRSRRRAGAPLRTSTWETKDGRRIRICDMADSHLRNTIGMIEIALDAYEDRLLEWALCDELVFPGPPLDVRYYTRMKKLMKAELRDRRNVHKQVNYPGPWDVDDRNDDLVAQANHEQAVAWVVRKLERGEKIR